MMNTTAKVLGRVSPHNSFTHACLCSPIQNTHREPTASNIVLGPRNLEQTRNGPRSSRSCQTGKARRPVDKLGSTVSLRWWWRNNGDTRWVDLPGEGQESPHREDDPYIGTKGLEEHHGGRHPVSRGYWDLESREKVVISLEVVGWSRGWVRSLDGTKCHLKRQGERELSLSQCKGPDWTFGTKGNQKNLTLIVWEHRLWTQTTEFLHQLYG